MGTKITGQQPGSKHRLGPCSQPGYLNRQCCWTLEQYGCRRDSRPILTGITNPKLPSLFYHFGGETSQQFLCVLRACVIGIRSVKWFSYTSENSSCFWNIHRRRYAVMKTMETQSMSLSQPTVINSILIRIPMIDTIKSTCFFLLLLFLKALFRQGEKLW